MRLEEFTKAIEFKEATETKLKDSAKAANLQHVALSLGLPEAYAIPANNDVRVLFYSKHEVVFDEAFARDKLTDAAIDKLVKTIDDKLTEIENEGRDGSRPRRTLRPSSPTLLSASR